MKHLIRKALAVSAVALCAATAFAQYPNRPITLIVPWGAGGGTDYHARTIGSMLEKESQATSHRRQSHRRLGRRGSQRHCRGRAGRLHHRHSDR